MKKMLVDQVRRDLHVLSSEDEPLTLCVCCRQLAFAPCFLGAFLCLSGALNGLTAEENVTKLRRVSASSSSDVRSGDKLGTFNPNGASVLLETISCDERASVTFLPPPTST